MKTLRKNIAGMIFIAQLVAATVASGAGLVSTSEVRRWQEMKTGFYLLDVRSGQAFNRKHIQGAINIPAFIAHKKGLPKGDTLVLYDSGVGSTEARSAAEKMSAAGYGKVFLLDGGLARWEANSLPLDAPLGVINTKLVETITVVELQQVVLDGTAMSLVDLRAPALFKAGSIPGAQSVPAAAFSKASAAWRKDDLVVLFDGGDSEAERQAEVLRRAGFKLIRFLHGGYPEWKRQNAS
jgi:3-mercaptopyruvate sulfurtransferase SseA